ncbi:small subunit ribosomal protein S9 [Verrucomicrobium sp. GAS474]|uniref:30S ribosomal protein S9 n=1 Tax=Verrucomicrobium sp. GAS474 TaxID=1882831 RepID=UPI00087D8409|nr:30S ribosomal protein S9 [Verrucomicrobium sp. GAS474]SDU03463.1 small subunit ribosomal protein S9 [Verrucomicrobium sp. GAS474]
MPTASPIQTTGRRKTAIVTVKLSPGTGIVTVNGRDVNDYFTTTTSRIEAVKPLNAIEGGKKFDFVCKAIGGGTTGQAGALSLAIARALIEHDAELRPALKKGGFLRRDPRMKERKKSGQPGARKRFQFSKR